MSAGGELVAKLKHDLVETTCCGLVVLPGVFTRLYIAKMIDEALQRAKREALLDAALDLQENPIGVMHSDTVAARLRSRAKKIRIRSQNPSADLQDRSLPNGPTDSSATQPNEAHKSP